MKTETFLRRIQPRLTKSGAVHQFDRTAFVHLYFLASGENDKWHYFHWSRSCRRFAPIGEHHFERFRQICILLGIDYMVGNDAPLGGAEGRYVWLPSSSRRKLKPVLSDLLKLVGRL